MQPIIEAVVQARFVLSLPQLFLWISKWRPGLRGVVGLYVGSARTPIVLLSEKSTRFRRLIAHSPVAPGLTLHRKSLSSAAALLCSGIWIRRECFRAASWRARPMATVWRSPGDADLLPWCCRRPGSKRHPCPLSGRRRRRCRWRPCADRGAFLPYIRPRFE